MGKYISGTPVTFVGLGGMNATASIPSIRQSTIEYVLVAGGGGGGNSSSAATTGTGGGGGAGGLLIGTQTGTPTNTTLTITVGAGGSAATQGGNTTISGTGLTSIVAVGGGYGGSYGGGATGLNNGGNGGSGGGGTGGGLSSPNNRGSGGTGVAGQGYAGATVTSGSVGGSGGSASANGVMQTSANYGKAPDGVQISPFGMISIWVCGAGAPSFNATNQNAQVFMGGKGGGANGASYGGNFVVSESGQTNTGGGGSSGLASVTGYSGGSGIAFVRVLVSDGVNSYVTPQYSGASQKMTTTSGSNTYHVFTFTSSGTITL